MEMIHDFTRPELTREQLKMEGLHTCRGIIRELLTGRMDRAEECLEEKNK